MDLSLLDRRISELLFPYQTTIGKDFTAYQHHVKRVAYLTCHLKQQVSEIEQEKIAITAVFHDLGLWTVPTFDYLSPSIALVNEYLQQQALDTWQEEINSMIDFHHKLTPYKGKFNQLVEPFRKADLIDLSFGVKRFGISTSYLKVLREQFPLEGFQVIIAKRFLKHWLSHPLRPLPMVKR
ncbi:MAG: HD domain-containing protein [Thermonemataceae bacterium]